MTINGPAHSNPSVPVAFPFAPRAGVGVASLLDALAGLPAITIHGPAHPRQSSAGCGLPPGHALQRSRTGMGGTSLLAQEAACTTPNAGN